MAEIEVCPLDELPPGRMRLVPAGSITIGVFNCNGRLYAIEDRCSHDDGPLAEGDWDPEACVVVCPRHGSRFGRKAIAGYWAGDVVGAIGLVRRGPGRP